jgi:hypothetical protein
MGCPKWAPLRTAPGGGGIRHRVDIKTASKSNEPVDDIRRRVALWRKGGHVGCATDASVGGKRIAFKLRRGCCEPATLECYRRSHEIALAELDAAMAQDVVGGGGVEIEIRQTEV